MNHKTIMRKVLRYCLVSVALSTFNFQLSTAQGGLDKQLEVTREYSPKVGRADKLPIAPNMVDTVRLRPEISYSITPTAWPVTFGVEPFAAASINTGSLDVSRTRLYVRAGFGAPFLTTADLYFTPRTKPGNTFGVFANHRGSFSKIKNDIGLKPKSTEMYNALGLFGSRRTGRSGRYVLAGDASYDNRLYNMYGYSALFAAPDKDNLRWERAGWNRVAANIGFGDDFTDLSHFNFYVGLDGGYTHRGGDIRYVDRNLFTSYLDGPSSPIYYSWERYTGLIYAMEKIRTSLGAIPNVFARRNEPSQADVGFKLRMGGMLNDRQGLEAEVCGRYMAARMDYGLWEEPAGGNSSGTMSFTPRYVLILSKIRVRAGIDLYYIYNHRFEQDRVRLRPALEVSYDAADGRFMPYATLSSRITNGDIETLSRLNPYIFMDGATGLETDLRLGFKGSIGGVFTYRLSGGASWLKDHKMFSPLFTNYAPVMFFPSPIDGVRYTFGAEMGLNIPGGFSAKLHGNWYQNEFDKRRSNFWSEETKAALWLPDFDFGIRLTYSHKDKFTLSGGVEVTGKREYTGVYYRYPEPFMPISPGGYVCETFSTPPVVDVSLAAEVKVVRDFWVFLEGSNLANQRLYPYPYYPGLGANAMAGIKAVF